MNFDEVIERRGTHCAKWDWMQQLYGVDPADGISMWVADMDFKAAKPIQDALVKMNEHGIYGYFGDDSKYRAAITGWMSRYYQWDVDPESIFTTHGLVNGTAMCVDTFTKPGDGVVLFTPVYYVFARVINAAERKVVECPLVNNDGRYEYDFDHYDTLMSGNEKMLILCSPHNPGGRVWTNEELEGVAAFARRHDLIIVSDEIHCDLRFDGVVHTPMAHIEGIEDRLIMMTSTTKSFNIAGAHLGNVIISDEDMRAQFAQRMEALGLSPNSFGMFMATAAYSDEGAVWLKELMAYIDQNRQLFDAEINAIEGAKSMRLEATYLAWVDFAQTGLAPEEIARRVHEDAKIASNIGSTFGTGGETFMRFNLATPKSYVEEAVRRLQKAFA